jgi:hypothetical protein
LSIPRKKPGKAGLKHLLIKKDSMPYPNTYIELLQIEFSGIDWDPGKSRKKDSKTYQ